MASSTKPDRLILASTSATESGPAGRRGGWQAAEAQHDITGWDYDFLMNNRSSFTSRSYIFLSPDRIDAKISYWCFRAYITDISSSLLCLLPFQLDILLQHSILARDRDPHFSTITYTIMGEAYRGDGKEHILVLSPFPRDDRILNNIIKKHPNVTFDYKVVTFKKGKALDLKTVPDGISVPSLNQLILTFL